jgi:putative DNA primase/helicase
MRMKALDVSDIKKWGGNNAVREFLDSAQPSSSDDEARPPEFSDDALALDFAERRKDDLRYVATWGRWLHFDGRHWEYDETLNVFDLVRQLCREAAGRAPKKNQAGIVSAKTVSAVERLAKSDRRLAATIDQWDSDPMLLNTPTGVINLRTGGSRSARPGDYMTKMTAVGPGGASPTWEKFIARITGGDAELAKFLQRVVGYLLTGLTVEHALFFGYGTGANGKSVMINTVSWIAFGYHKTAPIETFTLSSTDRHPTELAGLQGARIVTAIETEQGRRWAEARIKALTGGDPISARFMRQDFFEFTPQFKLFIAGNHKPSLRSVDEAMRRRFYLIPFNVTIPPEERDPNLAEKLKAEGPGILAWMIQGCLAWQRDGLSPPAVVREATEAYLAAENALASWIDDCCDKDPSAWESSTALFTSWKLWAETSGEPVGTMKAFAQNLERQGFNPKRQTKGRGFTGLKVRLLW